MSATDSGLPPQAVTSLKAIGLGCEAQPTSRPSDVVSHSSRCAVMPISHNKIDAVVALAPNFGCDGHVTPSRVVYDAASEPLLKKSVCFFFHWRSGFRCLTGALCVMVSWTLCLCLLSVVEAHEVGGIGVLGMAQDGACEARRKHHGKANRGSARSHCEKMQRITVLIFAPPSGGADCSLCSAARFFCASAHLGSERAHAPPRPARAFGCDQPRAARLHTTAAERGPAILQWRCCEQALV